jgi:hypothetical protein
MSCTPSTRERRTYLEAEGRLDDMRAQAAALFSVLYDRPPAPYWDACTARTEGDEVTCGPVCYCDWERAWCRERFGAAYEYCRTLTGDFVAVYGRDAAGRVQNGCMR